MMTDFTKYSNVLQVLTGRTTSVAFLFLLLIPLGVDAADITVNALFSGKAVLVIDGGKPQTLSAGQTTAQGVKLVSADSESAVIEYKGERQTLGMGQGTRVGSPSAARGAEQVTLTADARGHFITTGSINGLSVRFVVDTGATSVAISTTEARRLGINYLAGQAGRVSTANGSAPAYLVKLDNVHVGDITLTNVEGTVVDGAGLNVALLGMSFLNRTQMVRDGDKLTLTRRF
jgi:aspartyl protease family protein